MKRRGGLPLEEQLHSLLLVHRYFCWVHTASQPIDDDEDVGICPSGTKDITGVRGDLVRDNCGGTEGKVRGE